MVELSAPVMSLYEITLQFISDSYEYFKNVEKTLPETVIFDIFRQLHKDESDCLREELVNLDVFSRALHYYVSRTELIKCFQGLMDKDVRFAGDLANSYVKKVKGTYFKPNSWEMVWDLGIRLGTFFSDAGCYCESAIVLSSCKDLCLSMPDEFETWSKTLDCCNRLLHSEVSYAQYASAMDTKELAEEVLSKLRHSGEKICLAGTYTQFSLFSFHMSYYDQAYKYSVLAVKELENGSENARVTIEALSQASRSCVIKRDFAKAGVLIKAAVYMAQEYYGKNHPKYADALVDYGFFLLNSDSVKDSVTVYEKALRINQSIYEKTNIRLASTFEELAYALYVREYSTGRFYEARRTADIAISMMKKLLPEEHLLLASAQRVKALILEEIALDEMTEPLDDYILLRESEILHQDALRLTKNCFGEENVQTAKHYGNLGRLYQSMRRFKEAEAMHIKAIEIKERLLGKEDYEVGLSIGHLASLYNYHLNEHRKAEKLYYRSISISLRLFSQTYSGLEYDYRGLVHAYEKLENYDLASNFMSTISSWKKLRKESEVLRTPPLSLSKPPPIRDLIEIICHKEDET